MQADEERCTRSYFAGDRKSESPQREPFGTSIIFSQAKKPLLGSLTFAPRRSVPEFDRRPWQAQRKSLQSAGFSEILVTYRPVASTMWLL